MVSARAARSAPKRAPRKQPAAGATATRFKPGDPARISIRAVVGHCRTPWYLRGKPCTIAAVQGRFRDPERLAYHRPGWPAQVLYKVRVRLADLWPGYRGPAADALETDIYEGWLEPARRAKK